MIDGWMRDRIGQWDVWVWLGSRDERVSIEWQVSFIKEGSGGQ